MERYNALTSAYYKKAKCVIVVYDIYRKKAFEDIDKWIDDFKSKSDEDLVILHIENKIDLKDQREVEIGEASAKSQQNKMAFMETSAKDNYNVSKAFYFV